MSFTTFRNNIISKKFHNALSRSDLATLRRLLAKGVPPTVLNGADGSGWTPLFRAAKFYQPTIVKMLLEAGAEINHNGSQFIQNPINANTNDATVMKILIDAGANVNATDWDGQTPLHSVAKYSNYDVGKMLIEAGANVNARDADGCTPLHLASPIASDDLVTLLVLARANLNAVNKRGQTPLHTAILHGQYRKARILLDGGADATILDKKQMSALDYLLNTRPDKRSGEDVGRMMTLLVEGGATVNLDTVTFHYRTPSNVIRAIVPEDTPFWLAANNDAPMLAAELADGLDPNMKTANGMTLLHWACAGDGPECVQLLLDAGADVRAASPSAADVDSEDDHFNFSDHVEKSLMVFYAIHESADCLKHLIGAGANVNQLDTCIYPLDYAVSINSPKCVTELVRAGAWVTRDENRVFDNRSPAEHALSKHNQCIDALKALVTAAGDRVLGQKVGHRSLLDWAIENSTVDGVRVLVEGGAEISDLYTRYDTAAELIEHGFPYLGYDLSAVPRVTKNIEYVMAVARNKE